VTVRNLLTHTSGIHNYTSGRAWRSHWNEELSPATIAGFVASDTFDFAPGSKQSYSNTGYVLLGMIIEKVSGMPYAKFVEQHAQMMAPAEIFLPKDSVGVVVFTNDDSATPEIITLDLARIVLGIKPNGFGALDRPH
jgi:hypothetical protein